MFPSGIIIQLESRSSASAMLEMAVVRMIVGGEL